MKTTKSLSIARKQTAGRACAIAVVLLAGVNGSLFGATTVGVLNPTPPTNGIVNSPVNVGKPNFLGQGTMSLLVGNAFNNNQGGVIDWEPGNGWVANGQNAASQTVSYGLAQSKSLTISLAASTFGPTTAGGSATTSGVNYMGFQTGSPNTLSFSSPLTAWGMAQLNRGASRDVTFSFTLLDNSVISYDLQNQDPLGNNTASLNWYGILVSDANPITKVSFVANGFTRYDDMAFIVSTTPIPEPGTMALLGLGGALGIVALRRRRN